LALDDNLLRSALYDKHVALEARLGEEAGWLMPLSYHGALEEARTARSRAVVCDFSHAGRLRIRGAGALDLLCRAAVGDVVHQADDTAALTLLCNDGGGIIDCCHLVRLEDAWLVLTSPINRLKVLAHLQGLAEALDVRIDDQTEKTSQICVAGPAAPAILDAVLPEKVSTLADGGVRVGSMLVAKYVAMRISQTGLWSINVILPNMVAAMAWRFITEKAGDNRVAPAGLAAADVLRVEAGLPRYGHEINETIDPVTAGLGSIVRSGDDFLGAAAIGRIAAAGAARRRAGLVLSGPAADQAPAIPRLGAAVWRADGSEAGTVTSGTYSPTLDRPIALAYLPSDDAEIGTQLTVETSAGPAPAKVTALPFVQQGLGTRD
jgi:aminomethyltransferase